jgi:hypothetical protein
MFCAKKVAKLPDLSVRDTKCGTPTVHTVLYTIEYIPCKNQ